jgi:sigma-B regulation protein RsbU (phosphoserine phosphatase)
MPDISLSEVELQLEGGAIYIFTDGLTEGFTLDGSQLRVEGVKAAIERYLEAPPHRRIEAMLEPLVDGDRPLRDDITLLLLELWSATPLAATIETQALPEQLQELREELRSRLQGWGLARTIIDQVVLAVGEAAMNIVQHGFDGGDAEGKIALEVEQTDGDLWLRLLDSAPPAKSEEIRPRDLKEIRPGGLGIHFIREIMDGVEFLPAPAGWGNLLEMRKRID